jgi:hypothetical protein
MVRWEYATVKLYDYGSPEGETKRPKDIWVSPDGLLPILDKLGADGWEAFAIYNTDVLLKRPAEVGATASKSAVAAVPETAGKR